MINKAEQSIQKRPIQVIKHLQREQKAIKTRQLFGGDNIVFSATLEDIVALPGTKANWQETITIIINPDKKRLMLAEMAFSLYVNVDNNDNYLWPHGVSLTNDEIFNIEASYKRELAGANNAVGYYKYIFRILNKNTTPRDLYLHYQLIYQKVSLT
jgi:hypothetical protein